MKVPVKVAEHVVLVQESELLIRIVAENTRVRSGYTVMLLLVLYIPGWDIQLQLTTIITL